VRFLFVGWFSARKGIYDLLDAWKLSGLSRSGAELVLAGGTQDDLVCWREALPEGVSIAGRVAHADLPTLYRSADVFVFPSLFEGSARVILEAVASGLPVITTPEACDESCVVHGENGFRVTSGDAAMLSEKMCELAHDPALRREMSAQALAIASRFSWSAYGERCATACKELLGMTPC
jgi:glycosyltransferase involved in cell wall biosynthesis